jgi:hypothetical protein
LGYSRKVYEKERGVQRGGVGKRRGRGHNKRLTLRVLPVKCGEGDAGIERYTVLAS